MNIREIEHDRLLENLKTALKEYVDYAEYIKRANAAPKKRGPSKGPANTGGHQPSEPEANEGSVSRLVGQNWRIK